MKPRITALLPLAVAMATPLPTFAGLKGPYAPDVDTAFLFHLDDAAGSITTTNAGDVPDFLGDPAQAFSIDGTAERNTEATPYPTVSTILGATGPIGYGKAADFGTTAALGLMVDANGSNALSNRGEDATMISHFTLADANGSFTIEALINVPTITSGNRTIVSLDVDTGTRGLMFRINGSGQLEYAFNSGSGGTILLPIPTSGDDGFVANEWFHVAAVHDNSTGQHNTTFYWTRLDANRTQATVMGTSTAEIITPSVVGPFVIGNEVRDASGDSLRGKIDEVRVSRGVRGPGDFVFNSLPPDSDGDQMDDVWELQHFGNLSRTGTADADTNGGADGLTDVEEFIAHTDPNDSDSDNDTLEDGDEYDGLSNAFAPGNFTNPLDPDSDDDGLSDFQENGSLNTAFGNAPTDPNDADSDDDSYSDRAEVVVYGTNPNSATGSTGTPLIDNLIGTNVRNGSFELLGPVPGTANPAKASHWDTDPDGDVTYWTVWPVESTAETDSGAETGANTQGSKRGYLQNGNAVYNLTERVVAQGDILSLRYDHVAGGAALRGGIVYNNGGTITRLTEAEILDSATGNGRNLLYVVPAGSPIIGKQVGVGFKSTSSFPSIDSVVLTINAPDTDHDKLSDTWETTYFGNLAQTDTGDPDGDTFDNLAEQAAGSIPNNIDSIPGDIDGDDLTDTWEITNFNGLGATPGADPDNDRDTNLVEFTNNTNPNDKLSFFSSTGDTVPDSWKAFYNIAGQTGDSDLDEGTGDGVTNLNEFFNNTNPADKDSDDDGLFEGEEIMAGTNPLDADSDDDGLSDGQEAKPGTGLGTSPLDTDTDDDSFGDKYEVDHGSDPLSAGSTPTQPTGFTLIENFEGAGMTVGQTFNGVNGWTASDPANATVVSDPTGGNDKAGQWVNGTLSKSLQTLGLQIRDGQTGTLFFQLNLPTTATNHSYGLSDDAVPAPFNSFEAQLATISPDLQVRDAGTTPDTTYDYRTQEWMNIWMVANNSTDTVKVYVESPLAQTGVIEITAATEFNFRNGTATNGLLSLLFGENTGTLSQVLIDNIYVDTQAANLANPINAGGDSDSDGLPDTWETTNFGNLGQTAAGDFDGDGTDNLTEFRLGLHPNNGSSIFKAITSGTGAMSWPSAAGTTFKIERSTTLAAGAWTQLEAAYPAAGSPATSTSYTDATAPAGKAFYRITLNP